MVVVYIVVVHVVVVVAIVNVVVEVESVVHGQKDGCNFRSWWLILQVVVHEYVEKFV